MKNIIIKMNKNLERNVTMKKKKRYNEKEEDKGWKKRYNERSVIMKETW